MSSGRASAPAPLAISRPSVSGSGHDSFGSDCSDKTVPRSFSNGWAQDRPLQSRKSSASSSKSSKPTSPTANVYTHCGRHSDQWLLGGMSGLFKKKE
ncbi:uncharacterized protein BCR38DRAFT_481257 [Pseudomassariella vexata]|uniref:Uncharacterized protein n=1 Tax=Pseudomassariella vexata TaxID=1141098 RepID=A0A1Y2EEU9_9PEZI|nr:uncharacterized protein BCR38DRAFT_481257 [Pseudomassariella vexata]ORY70113.1 hypothetical protein BCR38DRAFT_481257 [Pseudomassariella vexata]